VAGQEEQEARRVCVCGGGGVGGGKESGGEGVKQEVGAARKRAVELGARPWIGGHGHGQQGEARTRADTEALLEGGEIAK
jgi:hypothetical protein